MSFSWALDMLKVGFAVHRKEGDPSLYLKVVETDIWQLSWNSGQSYKWVPTQEDLLAEDWRILEGASVVAR